MVCGQMKKITQKMMLCAIISLLLFSAIFPNIMADNSTYVCDGNYAWGYSGTNIGNVTTDPGGEVEFSGADYEKVKVNNSDSVSVADVGEIYDFAFHKFVFHINETVDDLAYLKIILKIRGHYYAKHGDEYFEQNHGYLYVKKDDGWSAEEYIADSYQPVIIVKNYTSNLGDYVDGNNNITFAFQNDFTPLAAFDLSVYYAEVEVGVGPPNTPPTIENPNPANNSVAQDLEFTWEVDISDDDADTFNWSIECDGQSNSSNDDTNGTFSLDLTGLDCCTEYTVFVNVTDGKNATNATFNFTTKCGPELSSIFPADGAVDVAIVYGHEYNWSLDMDEDGVVNNSDYLKIVSNYGATGAPGWIKEDLFEDGEITMSDVSAWVNGIVSTCLVPVSADINNWTTLNIYTNVSGSWAQMNTSFDDYYANMTDPGTIRCQLQPPELHHSTKYWWSVNATKDGCWTNTTYNFTTEDLAAPTSLSAAEDGRFQIDLTWTKETNANKTIVEWNTAADWARGDGTEVYNGTGETYSHTGLWPGTTYYYQAWSYHNCTHDYSLTNDSDDATTVANGVVTQAGETPANGTTGVSRLTDIINITIEDPEGDLINWTIETNLSDSSSGNNEGNGSKSCDTVDPLPPSTNITWWVNVTDGYNWTNASYWFVTAANSVPAFSDEDPSNTSESVDLNYTFEINISDLEDVFDWTIETSWGNSSSGTGETNGTKSCEMNGMNSSTNITVWVNATDGYNWTNETFWFITLDDDIPTYDNYWVNYTTGINVSTYNCTIEINGCNDTYPIERDLNFTVIHNGIHYYNNSVDPDDGNTSINITLVNGVNTIVFILEDWNGNNITCSSPLDLTYYNFVCVNESDGSYVDVSDYSAFRVTAPEIGWELDLKAKGDGNFTYLANTTYPGTLYPHSLRFEIAYIGGGTNITRYFDPTLLPDSVTNTTIRIAIPDGTETIYQTTAQSTTPTEFGVWCLDSEAWILLDRTRMVGGLGTSNYAQDVYTIDGLYYFRVYEDGVPIVLTTLDGGKAVTIDLDVLVLVNNLSEVEDFEGNLFVQKLYNNSLLIYYHNQANDSTKTQIEIYNSTGYHFLWHNETLNPNEFFIYFDWTTISPTPDINASWTIKATTSGGDEATVVVIPGQMTTPVIDSDGNAFPAILAVIMAVALAVFGLTLFSSSSTFAFFGPVSCGIGIFITVLAQQVWYLHLLQFVLIVLIVFMLLVFRYEYSTNEFSGGLS